MKAEIEKYLKEVSSFSASSLEHLESFRIKYISKKGIIAECLSVKALPETRKKKQENPQ